MTHSGIRLWLPGRRHARGAALGGAVAGAVALALTWLAPPAAAWGPLGHRAVGAVADTLLTDAARGEVRRLLADDAGTDAKTLPAPSLWRLSTWADEVRGTDADRPRWHYDNMPVCGAAGDPSAWCPQDACASRRIEPLLETLRDRAAPAPERALALKWLVHLVADMHQPLHAADYGQGANLVAVQLAERPGALPGTGRTAPRLSLHTLWDVRLVEAALHARGDDRPAERALRALAARARRLAPAQVRAPPAQWLAESNRLAREVALDYPGFSCTNLPLRPVPISHAYQRRAQRVITAQLAVAGARLAWVLNRALSP